MMRSRYIDIHILMNDSISYFSIIQCNIMRFYNQSTVQIESSFDFDKFLMNSNSDFLVIAVERMNFFRDISSSEWFFRSSKTCEYSNAWVRYANWCLLYPTKSHKTIQDWWKLNEIWYNHCIIDIKSILITQNNWKSLSSDKMFINLSKIVWKSQDFSSKFNRHG